MNSLLLICPRWMGAHKSEWGLRLANNLKLGQGKYRSLRSMDSSLYKKQA